MKSMTARVIILLAAYMAPRRADAQCQCDGGGPNPCEPYGCSFPNCNDMNGTCVPEATGCPEGYWSKCCKCGDPTYVCCLESCPCGEGGGVCLFPPSSPPAGYIGDCPLPRGRIGRFTTYGSDEVGGASSESAESLCYGNGLECCKTDIVSESQSEEGV